MQLVKNASPYWRLTATNIILDSAKQEESVLPYAIQNKMNSMKVTLQEGVQLPKIEISFKGLTLTELESPYFSEALMYKLYLGWYDFFGVTVTRYEVARGAISKAVVDYEKSGYSLKLELKPFASEYLEQPFKPKDIDKLKDMSLQEVLQNIAHLGGLDCVFMGDTMLQLLEEDKALLKEVKKYQEERGKKDLVERLSSKFAASADIPRDDPNYFAPWVTFFTSFPLTPKGTERISSNGYLFPNTPTGLLIYLKNVYFFNYEFNGRYMCVSATNHFDMVQRPTVLPQRYFKYRGGMAGEGTTADQMAELTASLVGPYGLGSALGLCDTLHGDPFADFTVVSTPQLTTDNLVAPSPKKVESKKTPSAGRTYDVTTVDYSINDGMTLGKFADKAIVMKKALANRDALKNAQAKKAASEAPYVLVNVPGVKSPQIKQALLASLANAKSLGQVARITGIIGAPDVTLGMYFYFEGRVKDTGYYQITGLEHIFDRSGFKTTLTGKLVQDPKPPTYTGTPLKKMTEAKVAKGKTDLYAVRIATSSGLFKLSGTFADITEAYRTGVYILGARAGVDNWQHLIEQKGLIVNKDYIMITVGDVDYKKLQDIEEKLSELSANQRGHQIVATGQIPTTADEQVYLRQVAINRRASILPDGPVKEYLLRILGAPR